MLERLELLIGKENIDKIKKAHITVLGLGGVGGYTVESLIRSGIENITIIDYDVIDESNLNRQIIALNTNIGEKKTKAFKKRIKEINKNVNIKIIDEFIDEKNINKIFENKITYLIDACDYLKTKKLIIEKCLEKKTKFITCTGTGNRMDPSKLEIIDLRKTNNDPVAKILRKYVKDNKINKKITCLCSKEVPLKKGKVIGSNSFVPASAGLLITSYVINEIIKEEKSE